MDISCIRFWNCHLSRTELCLNIKNIYVATALADEVKCVLHPRRRRHQIRSLRIASSNHRNILMLVISGSSIDVQPLQLMCNQSVFYDGERVVGTRGCTIMRASHDWDKWSLCLTPPPPPPPRRWFKFMPHLPQNIITLHNISLPRGGDEFDFHLTSSILSSASEVVQAVTLSWYGAAPKSFLQSGQAGSNVKRTTWFWEVALRAAVALNCAHHGSIDTTREFHGIWVRCRIKLGAEQQPAVKMWRVGNNF